MDTKASSLKSARASFSTFETGACRLAGSFLWITPSLRNAVFIELIVLFRNTRCQYFQF